MNAAHPLKMYVQTVTLKILLNQSSVESVGRHFPIKQQNPYQKKNEKPSVAN
jgi:hypothetical protein